MCVCVRERERERERERDPKCSPAHQYWPRLSREKHRNTHTIYQNKECKALGQLFCSGSWRNIVM